MKTIHVISLAILFISPLHLMGQYVCYDEDGYTNVRKGQGTRYEIVDKVSKYELFFSSDWLCADGNTLDSSLTWIPFARSHYDYPNGFIYRKNIRILDDMPTLRWDDTLVSDPLLLSCSNDTISINLVMKEFDANNHVVEYIAYDDEYKFIKSIDGESPKGFYYPIESDKVRGKEMDALYIERGNRRTYLPIDVIKNYFNLRGMVVFLGYENELYIYIGGGDASESFGIYLSVVDGEIKFTLEYGAC